MNNKYKSLARNTLIFAIGSIGSKIILFLLVPLYTNYMSTGEYGTADYVFTAGEIIIPFVSAGIFSAVIRFGISKEVNRNNVLRNALFVITVGSAVMLLAAPFFGLYKTLSEWKWYLAIYVITTLYSSVEMNYLKAKELNKLYSAISLARTLIYAVSNILLLVVFRLGVKGYLMSSIVGCVFTMACAALFGRLIDDFKQSNRSIPLLKEMLHYSAPLIINGISWWIIHSSDKAMIEYMIGAAALGIYAIAGKIPSVINVIVSIFSQAWDISSIKEIENTKETDFFDDIFGMYSYFVFFLTIIASTFIKPFMQIYVGAEFREAWVYVPLLLVSAAYGAIGSFFASFFGALKKSKLSMWSTLIGAGLNIVLNFFLIPVIGIWGAIIGTVVSYSVIALYRMFAVLHFVNIKFNKTVYFINFFIILVQALFLSLQNHGYLISMISIALFLLLNHKNGRKLTKRCIGIVRKLICKKG